MKRYGKTLMHHVPEGTTLLLKGLCTNYQPSGDTANSEEFIPIFANNPRELKAFLDHMIKVDPHSPQGVYDTLLELRLQDWAHEQDLERKNILQEEALSLLRSNNTVFDKALVLCQMHNFKEGILYLYEKGKLYQQIMHHHMQNEEYGKVVQACKQYGEQECCLWEQALGYFARKEEDCKAYISEVLRHIDQKNLMPPLLVVQTLAHNSTATLSVIKDYLISKMQRESQQIDDDEHKICQYREETAHVRSEIQELKTSAKIFQKTKCSMCNSPLELPSVHFLCSHSFHQHCFESYAESEAECPTCTPENRKVIDMLRAQDQKRDLHDLFNRQLHSSNDGFSVVADYFGRGVFNKLTLVTDPPGSRAMGDCDIIVKVGGSLCEKLGSCSRQHHSRPKNYRVFKPVLLLSKLASSSSSASIFSDKHCDSNFLSDLQRSVTAGHGTFCVSNHGDNIAHTVTPRQDSDTKTLQPAINMLNQRNGPLECFMIVFN
uniref:VPS11 core subunit of CORVET and HOPS complexes n=1 Tax=Kryptolebias marmoratus TaxID=37003 RepID=A0A3Q3AAW1_KRYMA